MNFPYAYLSLLHVSCDVKDIIMLEYLYCVSNKWIFLKFVWFLDIDECVSSPCEHICANTPGSYHCLCQSGYEFDPLDSSSCHGE